MRRRAYVLDVVTDVYERYGFEPLETPAVENIETLLGKYGEEGNRLIFKILKRGEHEQTGQADLALRYDLTVPLARVVAEYRGKLPKFFKRYQIQPVWRADRPARGRFREFYQCDVDAIGSTSPVVEAEVCARGQRRPFAPGLHGLHDPLNHREVLRGLLDGAGVPEALHDTALVAIDKLDKIGGSGVIDELVSRGVDPHAAATEPSTRSPLQARRPAEALLGRLSQQVGGHASGARECRRCGPFCSCLRRHLRVRACGSILRSPAACRTTPARSSRSRWKASAASAAAGATTTWWVCSPASRCRPAGSRWGSSASSW